MTSFETTDIINMDIVPVGDTLPLEEVTPISQKLLIIDSETIKHPCTCTYRCCCYPNQDFSRHLISSDQTNGIVILGDGHGDYGHIASRIAIDYLVKHYGNYIDALYPYLSSFCGPNLDMEDQIQEEFNRLFLGAHSAVRNAFLEINPRYCVDGSDPHGVVRSSGFSRKASAVRGGTTLTVVLFVQMPDSSYKIITANVGDSEAHIMKIDSSSTSNLLKYELEVLTQDHSPTNIGEYLRIKELDETKYPIKLESVYNYYGSAHICESKLKVFNKSTDKPNPVPVGVNKTTVRDDFSAYARMDDKKYDIVSIAMTRAIGDFAAHQYGMTYEPSVSVKTVDQLGENEHYTIITASDGLWDCVKYDEFAEVVRNSINRYQLDTSGSTLSQILCSYAETEAKRLYRKDQGHDDITVSVIYF